MTADLEQKSYSELWTELRAVEKKKHELEKTFREPSRDRRDDKKRTRRDFDRDDNRDRKRTGGGDLRHSGSDWRDRENVEDDTPKVSSTVVSVAPVSTITESKPTKTTGDEKTRTRTRNLLGKLLVGTLNQFKQDIAQKSEVQVRREEIESRIDEKVSVERQQEMEKAKQALEEHKERANAISEILRKKEEEHQVQNLSSFWAKHEQQLSSFIKTKEGGHVIYYMPAKHNEKTAALVPVKEQTKEESSDTPTAADDNKPTPMETNTNEGDDNGNGSDKESDRSDDENGGERRDDDEDSKPNEEESSEKQEAKDE